jgi:hypothetical protein
MFKASVCETSARVLLISRRATQIRIEVNTPTQSMCFGNLIADRHKLLVGFIDRN